MLKLYNTLTRKKENFKPLKDKEVGLYSCGPTVYWFAHLGNLRTYIFVDILRRVLDYNGYKVKQVMNITDVGHLTSDADTGEDKMEKGAKREGKTAWEIAEFYSKTFKEDLSKLNVKEPDIWTKATDYIKEQIELIQILESKGFAYRISDGIYFDTSKIKDYGKLAGKKERKLKAGARIEMIAGKKSPADFALWKLTPPGVKRQMEWDSPWGRGFPGWHTECVAMSTKKLGVPFDIHTGGIDHISIHHTNEMAQAQAAFGKNLANWWLHNEFVKMGGGKMAKSEGKIITLKTLTEKGFNPLAYRYLTLMVHYRKPLDFGWEALKNAENSYQRFKNIIAEIKDDKKINKKYLTDFEKAANDDLDIPKSLAVLWELVRDKKAQGKIGTIKEADKIFGLNLLKKEALEIPEKIKEMVETREECRKEKKWQEADEIRKKIKEKGWEVEDTETGPKLKNKKAS